ncbi:3-hydroxyacyl-CoA dehydrogenase NAD-binding domain-containing protein, partial [Piscinibacter sp.]|uniref:3-hydroxyacyl-CoA dehydrogenase NAD-binding domain-containing protein n=1 Tax=Piscinibacter sp. TaxID=1903157 RepID=UPI003783EAC8
MGTIRYELGADGIATITHDAPGAPVNTMTVQWQADLAAVVERVEADKERIKGVLVTSAKKTFFAGAQLDSVLTMTEADAPAAFAAIEAMKRSFRRLETLGRPVVALLNGAALGGGWELALAAHARFALDERGERTVRFGTPEVSLGLIPGATGITKTVRLLGLMAAQPLLMEGKLFGPREALELGLVDGIGSTMDDLREMALAWIAEHPQAQQPWDRKDYRMPGGTPASPKIAMGLTVAPAMLAAKSRGLYPAAQAILEAMVEGALVDYDTATRIESRKLAKIMTGQTARNMIQAFFYDLNAIKAGKARPQGVSPWKPKRVGVIGAGMMGAGIAQANASRGIPCVLEDVAIDKARQAAKHELVTPSADVADLKGCELIIEAVFEQRALKAQVTREAEPLLAEGGIFASNTSTLPISGLAQASAAPQRFVGLHFFSPVHRMKLVEIIRGKATDDETIARAYDYVLALGKTPIVVNDSRGFFTSRVFGTYVMEGAAMLEEGIAAPLVEHAAEAAGMPVGPLALADEVSIELMVKIAAQTRADLGSAYVEGPTDRVGVKMVKTLGRLGKKIGKGFYDYPEVGSTGGTKHVWPGLAEHFPVKPEAEQPSVKQVVERLILVQSVETARCLEEGV